MKCPVCGKNNSDNWPLDVGGEIIEGGCQSCWESEVSEKWWNMVTNNFEPVLEIRRNKNPGGLL